MSYCNSFRTTRHQTEHPVFHEMTIYFHLPDPGRHKGLVDMFEGRQTCVFWWKMQFFMFPVSLKMQQFLLNYYLNYYSCLNIVMICLTFFWTKPCCQWVSQNRSEPTNWIILFSYVTLEETLRAVVSGCSVESVFLKSVNLMIIGH